MQSIKAKAFKKQGDFIYIYEDAEGTDCIVALPVWMFNQMVETYLNVRIAS